MNSDIEVIAIHGWAFDHNCWNKWIEQFPPGSSFSCYDRGYYSKPNNVSFADSDRKKILLLHSFGLHLCPPELFVQADLAAVFGGFRVFHPTAAQFRRRSRLVLQYMKQKLSEQPETVLKDFWSNTYHPIALPSFNFDDRNEKLLMEDLDLLGRSELNIEAIRSSGRICILHGTEDQIVPRSKGRELFNILSDQASYLETRNAGHALPMTHVEQCWSFLKPRVENLG